MSPRHTSAKNPGGGSTNRPRASSTLHPDLEYLVREEPHSGLNDRDLDDPQSFLNDHSERKDVGQDGWNDAPQAPSLGPVWVRLFGSETSVDIERVKREIQRASYENREPDWERVDPRISVLPSRVQNLPVRLRPWQTLLARWEEIRLKTLKARFSIVPAKLRSIPEVELGGPILPRGYMPWIVSASIDPGESRDQEKGFTTLLLVAAPRGWEPPPMAAMIGRWWEMECPRLDALVMRIPIDWWTRWATGAYADGALYFIPFTDDRAS